MRVQRRRVTRVILGPPLTGLWPQSSVNDGTQPLPRRSLVSLSPFFTARPDYCGPNKPLLSITNLGFCHSLMQTLSIVLSMFCWSFYPLLFLCLYFDFLESQDFHISFSVTCPFLCPMTFLLLNLLSSASGSISKVGFFFFIVYYSFAAIHTIFFILFLLSSSLFSSISRTQKCSLQFLVTRAFLTHSRRNSLYLSFLLLYGKHPLHFHFGF